MVPCGALCFHIDKPAGGTRPLGLISEFAKLVDHFIGKGLLENGELSDAIASILMGPNMHVSEAVIVDRKGSRQGVD